MLSKTTQSEALPPPSTPGARGAVIAAAVFPTLGGVAVALWLEDVAAGLAAYYALLALALLSPEGAALRQGFARPDRREPAEAP